MNNYLKKHVIHYDKTYFHVAFCLLVSHVFVSSYRWRKHDIEWIFPQTHRDSTVEHDTPGEVSST